MQLIFCKDSANRLKRKINDDEKVFYLVLTVGGLYVVEESVGKRRHFGLQKVAFKAVKGYLLHDEMPPFSGFAVTA